MARHCFYCGVEMTRAYPVKKGMGGFIPSTETIDHVFPKRIIRHEKRSDEWHGKNQVFCCAGCNARKGNMHPLKWLVICTYPRQLMRLLVELGVPKRRVEKWEAKRARADADPA